MKYLLLLLLTTSCTTVTEYSQANRVITKEYELHVYDCSNMAYDLTLALRLKGVDARIYAYDYGGKYGHAIVEIMSESAVVYLDPTKRIWRVPKPKYSPTMIWTPSQLQLITVPAYVELILKDYLGHLSK